jgi:prolipoprotein diacylglyceryl transferase
MWAVPFGIVGGRLYHVATDWRTYFGPDGAGFGAALAVWRGGLGIWGAIALGCVGVWIAVRRAGLAFPPMADALCVGVALAQAIGRWGNWFNQELFGKPTDLPWALQIAPAHRPAGDGQYETFHPTFLYESIWLVIVAGLCAWADRRFRMGHGRVFALYVAAYCVGRLGMETLRIDPATHVGGLRINMITSVVVGLSAVGYLLVSSRLRPGREAPESLAPVSLEADQPAPVGQAARAEEPAGPIEDPTPPDGPG